MPPCYLFVIKVTANQHSKNKNFMKHVVKALQYVL